MVEVYLSLINNKYSNIPNIPMGLSMALAQDIDAMGYFTSLAPDEQQEIINHTHAIQSKNEMQEYVNNITHY